MKLNKLIALLFVFLFCAFLNIPYVNAIYRDTYETTIKLTIEAPKCNVTFEEDGGDVVQDMEVTCGTAIGTLPSTSKIDYNFGGWYEEDTLVTIVTEEKVINTDVTFYADWIPEGKAARIGNTFYDTLQLAINAVPETGVKTTVKVLKDLDESGVAVSKKRNVELDLNGYELSNSNTSTSTLVNNGILDMKNGTVTCASSSGCVNNESYAKMTLTDVTIESTGSRQALYVRGGTVIIDGNTIIKNSNNQRAALQIVKGSNNAVGNVIIKSGTVEATNFNAIVVDSGQLLTIGTDDDTLSTTNPVIKGKTFGVQSSTNVYFYDGIVEGQSNPFSDNGRVVIKTNTTKMEGFDGQYKTNTLAYISTFNHTVNFVSDNATVSSREVMDGNKLGELPTISKNEYQFMGWFTEEEGGVRVTPDTIIDENKTYYAHYVLLNVCKRAQEGTLHTFNTTTYGSIQTGDTISPGDAFDCDVNGDNVRDPDTERFYYLRTDENGNAVLIYYNNTSANNNYAPSCAYANVSYGSAITGVDNNGNITISTGNVNNYGPNIAYNNLPTIYVWKNVTLANMGARNIVSDTGANYTDAGVIQEFTYTDRAARMATLDDIKAACGLSSINLGGHTVIPESCRFLFENIGPACSEASGMNTFWIETPKSNAADSTFRIQSENTSQYVMGFAKTYTGHAQVKPVIEVPLDSLILESDEQEPESPDSAPTTNSTNSVPQSGLQAAPKMQMQAPILSSVLDEGNSGDEGDDVDNNVMASPAPVIVDNNLNVQNDIGDQPEQQEEEEEKKEEEPPKEDSLLDELLSNKE